MKKLLKTGIVLVALFLIGSNVVFGTVRENIDKTRFFANGVKFKTCVAERVAEGIYYYADLKSIVPHLIYAEHQGEPKIDEQPPAKYNYTENNCVGEIPLLKPIKEEVHLQQVRYNTRTVTRDKDGNKISETFSWGNDDEHDNVTDGYEGITVILPKTTVTTVSETTTNNPDGSTVTVTEYKGIFEKDIEYYSAKYGGLVRDGFNVTYSGIKGTIKDIKAKLGNSFESYENDKDPINMIFGNYYGDKTDYVYNNGSIPIKIQRNYNSFIIEKNEFGYGWRFNYSSRLIKYDDIIEVYRADGKLIKYHNDGTGVYKCNNKPTNNSIIINSDGTYVVRQDDNSKYIYNVKGQWVKLIDKNNNYLDIIYENDKVIKIVNEDNQFNIKYSGNIIKEIITPTGDILSYSYSNECLTSVSDTRDNTTKRYTYNSDRRLTSCIDKENRAYITNSYDEIGRVKEQIDGNGNKTSFSYRIYDRTSISDSLNTGERKEYIYNDDFRVIEIKYNDGTNEKYEYDSYGRKISYADRKGLKTTYTYKNETSNIESITSPRPFNYVTKLEYDNNNNLIKIIYPSGREEKFEYDDKNNIIKHISTIDKDNNAITTFNYDQLGRAILVKNAEGNSISYEYNGKNKKPCAIIGYNNTRTDYTYDNLNRVSTVTTNNYISEILYYPNNRIKSVKDAEGNITKFEYDNQGNLIKKINPEQQDTNKGFQYNYDAMDNLIKQTDPIGNILKLNYNGAYKISKIVNPNVYNDISNDGQGISYEYDTNNRKIHTVVPSGQKSRIVYDSNGNIIKKIDTNNYDEGSDSGKGISYIYDNLNRLTIIKDTEGNVIKKYIYDIAGNIIKEIDAEGYKSGKTDETRIGKLYKYNLAGWLIEKRLPLKIEANTAYYKISKYTYDRLGRITSEIKSNDYVTKTLEPSNYTTINYTYNSNNQITRIIDSTGGEIIYKYDFAGNILTQKTKLDNDRYQESGYDYDKIGRITSEYIKLHKDDMPKSYADQADEEGYIKSITNYKYDRNGNITKTISPEGYITTFEYDDADRLIRKSEQVTKNTVEQQHVKLEITSPRKRIYDNQTYTYKIKINSEETIKDLRASIKYDPRIYEFIDAQTKDDNLEVNSELGNLIITGNNLSLKGISEFGEITLKTKTDVLGIGYITFKQDTYYTNDRGEQKDFTELIGHSQIQKGPDMNDDNKVMADDFTLTALKKGITSDDNKFIIRYDINNDNLIGTQDLDYISDWLFNEKSNTSTKLETIKFNLRKANISYDKKEELVHRTTTYEYDRVGNLLKVAEADGKYTSYQYDLLNRITKETDSEGNTYHYIYDEVGNVIKKILPENYTGLETALGTSYTYDSMNRLLEVRNEENKILSKNIYNISGRIMKVIDSHNYYLGDSDSTREGTEYTYDIGGRITKITTPESKEINKPTISYTYDAGNNVSTVTDGEGYITTYIRDIWGKAIEKINAKGVSEKYTYNSAGNITSSQDGNDNITYYQYTLTGQLRKVIDPSGKEINYLYDKQGRLIEEVDRKGQKINYTYNSDNNLTKKWIENTKDLEEYLYNKDGTLLAAINKDGVQKYTYTSRNRIRTKTYNDANQLTYTYNKNNAIKTVVTANKSITKYNYDQVGRIKTVSDDTKTLATYNYNSDSTLKNIEYSNDITTSYTYDKNTNIIGLTHNKNNETINNYTYTYNNNNVITSQTLNGQTTKYTYDEIGQITKVLYPQKGLETYSYDNVGNRLTKENEDNTVSYIYNNLNQLTSQTENDIMTTYHYDLNGNMIKSIKKGEVLTHSYNGFNQLEQTSLPDGAWQQNTYNPLGLRSSITENGLTTNFTYNGQNVITEGDIHNNIKRTNIYGNSLISLKDEAGTDYYYLHNLHTDVVAIADDKGNIANKYQYDVFGQSQTIKQRILNRHQYAGEQFDQVTGNYYLRARYYNPTIGRFLQEDSYRGDGLNLYAYVKNNPVMYVDPSGHNSMTQKELDNLINELEEQGISNDSYIIQSLKNTVNIDDTGKENKTECPNSEGMSEVELIIEHTDKLADEGPSKIRTIYFAIFYPYAALQIGEVKHGKTNISTNAVRFATNELGLIETASHEGSQVNAYRHALWQATITNRFDAEIAEGAGNAHEEDPNAIFGVKDFSAATYSTSSLADESCDLLNNIIGRGIGKGYTTTTKMNEIAIDILDYYHEYGLWIPEEQEDGNYIIYQQKLSDSQYETAYNRLRLLDENGYEVDK